MSRNPASVLLVKAHAYGNDFLIVAESAIESVTDTPGFARSVCDRHRGIGADGVMLMHAMD